MAQNNSLFLGNVSLIESANPGMYLGAVSITNTGFTGMQGATGDVGPTGFAGQTGMQGATGDIGPTGFAGQTGMQGATGDIGPTGFAGQTGMQGATGDVGPTGFAGQTGDRGATGDIGPTGFAGQTGMQGATGFDGQTGLMGPTGDRGATGFAGETGMMGPTGDKGATGDIGATYAIGTGLAVLSNTLYTVGNPSIQTVSNVIYINSGITDIQTAINAASSGTVINLSSGSYGGATVIISGVQNVAIIAPVRGQGTICELSGGRGLTLATSSSVITINSLQIEGLLTLASTGNNYFTNIQCLSGVTISPGSTGNYFFNSCEIAGLVSVPSTFGGVIVFAQCNFAGASFSLLNSSPLQVQFALNTNLPTTRPTNATYGSANSDTSLDIITNTDKLIVNDRLSYTSSFPIGIEVGYNEDTYCSGIIVQNRSAGESASAHIICQNDKGSDSEFYADFGINSSGSTVEFGQFATISNVCVLSSQSSSIVFTPNAGNSENQARNNNIMLTYDNGTKCHLINNNGQLVLGADNPSYSGDSYGGDSGENNKVLTSNGVSGLKWTPMGGEYSSYTNNFLSGQQTVKNNTFIILLSGSFANKLPDYPTIVDCVFNFSVSPSNSILTLTYINNKDSSTVSYTQTLSRNGHHCIPVKFLVPQDAEYDYNFAITGALSTGSISTDANDFVCAEFRQIKGVLPL